MKYLIPNLFFLFLTAPILSPFIGGITLYLSFVVIFFDLRFLLWVFNRFSRDQIVILISLAFFMSVAGLSVSLFVKIQMLLVSVLYMFYCYQQDTFYLYRWITLSVIVGIAQFVLIFVDPAKAYLIGPTSISTTLLGKFAGPTFTNFFAISLLPRVSGLSREGGFFASLLGVAFFIVRADKSISNKMKIFYTAVILIGLLISLSKTTLILLIVPVILWARRYINLFKETGVILLYTTAMIIFFNYQLLHTGFFKDMGNVSLVHRFSGYALSPYASIQDLLKGVDIYELMERSKKGLEAMTLEFRSSAITDFCGLPALYLGYGLPTLLGFILMVRYLKLTGTGIALIIILTTNVNPVTSDGFVILAWFFTCFVAYGYREQIFRVNQSLVPL